MSIYYGHYYDNYYIRGHGSISMLRQAQRHYHFSLLHCTALDKQIVARNKKNLDFNAATWSVKNFELFRQRLLF